MLETTLIKWFGDSLHVSTSHNIPKRYPDQFITIERQGGQIYNMTEHAMFGILVWARTSERACELAHRVRDLILSNQPPDEIRSISIDGMYEYRTDENEMGRYQINLEIIANIGD